MGLPTERDTKLMRRRIRASKRAAIACVVAASGLAIAGCGEVSNTIKPNPGTENKLTVVISGQPNGFYVGLYEAQALGYFKQTDMDVTIVPETGTTDPLSAVHGGQALVGIASTPTILLHRNENQPLVGIAAIVHSPLTSIKVPTVAATSGGTGLTTSTSAVASTTTATSTATTATTTTATTSTSAITTSTTGTRTSLTGTGTGKVKKPPTTTTIGAPDAVLWPEAMQKLLGAGGVPTYDGLVIVARKGTIVDHSGLLRRFVQAVARGYRAAKRNPTGAVQNLITAVPSLAPTEALQLNTVNDRCCLTSSRRSDHLGLAERERTGTRSAPGCYNNKLIEHPQRR